LKIDLAHWQANLLPLDKPGVSLESYVQSVPNPEDFDLREKLNQWQEEGVVTFEGVVNSSELNSFEEDVFFLNDNRNTADIECEYRGQRYPLKDLPVPPLSDTGIKLNCLENVSLAARKLSLNHFVSRFLSHVFQEPPVVMQSLTFWRGSEQPAHLDYPWVCVQNRLPHLAASWIPLEDIHADAGPLAYFPGSHKQGLLDPYDWGNGSLVQLSDSSGTPAAFCEHLASEVARLNLRKKVFLPRRGDVLIWHGGLLHEGTKVRDETRTRRSYVTHYTSLSSYPESHMHRDAWELKRFTNCNGGYVFDHPWSSDERMLPSWSIDPKA
jgi:phytanoyl-CoA hydroxylase